VALIKVNLCPIDELDNKYWYVPELVVCLVVAVVGYYGFKYYFDTVEDEIRQLEQSRAAADEDTKKLEPHLERFKTLQDDIRELNTKIVALKSITTSKISRYKPLIALEHLQNLKPDGVWFESITLSADDAYAIRGRAFDNILVAELMTSLKATETQDTEGADLRTKVYFKDLTLEATIAEKPPAALFPDSMGMFPSFSLRGRVAERPVGGPGGGAPGPGGGSVPMAATQHVTNAAF
jgi:hypothetical protein